MPRRAKRKHREPHNWHLLDAEQQRVWREWLVPVILEADTTQREYHIMCHEADVLLIVRGHTHTDALRAQQFYFQSKRGMWDIVAYKTRAVIQGRMFKMTLRTEGE